MRAAPLLRLARATVFATVCLVLGLLAHAAAGGEVGAAPSAIGLGLSAATGLALGSKERGLPVILAVLGSVQMAIHLVFAAAHAIPTGESLAHCATPTFGMTVLHAAAVTLTAVWLARGEAACWALIRLLAGRVATVLLAWAIPDAPKTTTWYGEPPAPPASAARTTPLSRRGPPVVISHQI